MSNRSTRGLFRQRSYEGEIGRGSSRNLIIVSNNSENVDEVPFGMFSRNSSRQDMSRNNSISNLFHNFQQPSEHRHEPYERRNQPYERYESKKEHLSDEQKYAKECLQYQKWHFDDKIRLIIHRMAILAYHSFRERDQHSFLSFALERFLCTIAKKLLLNRFQLLFLEYVLEQSKWRYDIDPLPRCAQEFKHFLHVPEAQNPQGIVRQLQVYLLFTAYYSKKSLNDVVMEGSFNHFLNSVSRHFKDRYAEWSENAGVMNIRIQPKTLNVIFRKLTSFGDRQKDYLQSYNLLVEQILDISPAYNASSENKGKRGRKKNAVVNNITYKSQDSPPYHPEDNYQRQIRQIHDLPPDLSPQEEPPLRKKGTSYASNIDGLDPVAYYNKSNR